jgi:anti-sigma regulatory factor (Ser/Thr protein kinase)
MKMVRGGALPSPAQKRPSVVAELSLQIAGGPDAPSEARSALRRFHPELPVDLMQVIVLLASELVANAVKHAASELVSIRCAIAPQHVRVEVADEGPGFTPEPTAPDPGTIGGWGLHLVDELSSRWGVVDGPGARVWFEIDR